MSASKREGQGGGSTQKDSSQGERTRISRELVLNDEMLLMRHERMNEEGSSEFCDVACVCNPRLHAPSAEHASVLSLRAVSDGQDECRMHAWHGTGF